MIDRTSGFSQGAAQRGAYIPQPQEKHSSSAACQQGAAGGLKQFQQTMRRFLPAFEKLPFRTQATCSACRKVVPAVFAAADGGVAVTFDCPSCGSSQQFHHDAIYTPTVSDRPGSPTHTLGGARLRPVVRRLPRTVETLCPQCQAILVGRVFVEDGAVWMEKTCPEHGYFRDCLNRDARLYAKALFWSFEEHAGQACPQTKGTGHCPSDCGLCRSHQSSSCLANLDLTNRCNLRCPICFANAGVTGKVYEPSFEQVVQMLKQLRDLRPIPATAIQFSGGEPTLHPQFHRIVAAAREMGFSNIQIATNGITHANLSFAQERRSRPAHAVPSV